MKFQCCKKAPATDLRVLPPLWTDRRRVLWLGWSPRILQSRPCTHTQSTHLTNRLCPILPHTGFVLLVTGKTKRSFLRFWNNAHKSKVVHQKKKKKKKSQIFCEYFGDSYAFTDLKIYISKTWEKNEKKKKKRRKQQLTNKKQNQANCCLLMSCFHF